MTGTLYVVGTPIGNLEDLTDRARSTLRDVDVIAAEDTRRTGRLLKAIGVSTSMLSFFEDNERARTRQLLTRLREGHDVALVTDGGMPSVSDPGFVLVRACADEGIDVKVVPGPSAAVAALVVSGLPTDRFVFEGFLPRKPGERRRRLKLLAADDRTLVVFESPRRLAGVLRDLVAAMGDRRVAVCRELTKLHEEVMRGSAAELAERLADSPIKGEVVVVVEGARQGFSDLAAAIEDARLLVREGSRVRDASRIAAKRHGVRANEVYAALVEQPD